MIKKNIYFSSTILTERFPRVKTLILILPPIAPLIASLGALTKVIAYHTKFPNLLRVVNLPPNAHPNVDRSHRSPHKVPRPWPTANFSGFYKPPPLIVHNILKLMIYYVFYFNYYPIFWVIDNILYSIHHEIRRRWLY